MPLKIITEGTTSKEVVVFSYSSYSVYRNCPKRYWMEKVQKVPKIEDETYTIPGRILHHAAGKFFSEDHTLEYFNPDALMAELDKYSKLPTVNLKKAYGSKEKAFGLIIKSSENLQSFLLGLDQSHQFMSEQWFGTWNAPYKITDNFYLQGAADLIDIAPTGEATLYDYKTSWNTRNASADQLILYAIVAYNKWQVNVTRASFFLLPVNRQEEIELTLADKQRLLNEMQTACNEILTVRDALPCRPNDKCKYCPYSSQCGAIDSLNALHEIPEGQFSFDAEL